MQFCAKGDKLNLPIQGNLFSQRKSKNDDSKRADILYSVLALFAHRQSALVLR